MTTEQAEQAELITALAGDADAFRSLTDRYRRELHVHCYRLLGSFHDAEEAVQETMLRAWRHLATFKGHSSFRAWLYRIATNVCLSRGRARARQVGRELLPALAEEVAHGTEPSIHLTPYPDALLDELEATWGDPVAEYDMRESVQLAFLAVIQWLPPRQRAALILRDVLGWSLGDVAATLESTVASVNSALNRARTTIEQQRAAGRLQSRRVAPSTDVEDSLLQRYVNAFEAADVAGLASVLREDVVLSMPPLPLRYTGREAVVDFYRKVPLAVDDQVRFVPTRANRQPALAAYRLDPAAGVYRPLGIWVFVADGDLIGEITAFVDPTLLAAFGLPAEL
ncbi:MAG: RNA polymerase subunit sigma-70 [Chloroflexi bacterium]|nr:RNA polymerase subunit sigma-70 [Chloroflexota bacterium]